MEDFVELILPVIFSSALISAVINGLFNAFKNRKDQHFKISLETRKDLLSLHKTLTETNNCVLFSDESSTDCEVKEKILKLEKQYQNIIEIYKIFLVHYGKNYAYELNSAIYRLFLEFAKDDYLLTNDDYIAAYSALRDTTSLLLTDIRYSLIKINNLKSSVREDLFNKLADYQKYGQRIYKHMNENKILQQAINEGTFEVTNPKIKTQTKIFVQRIEPFEKEYHKTIKKDYLKS